MEEVKQQSKKRECLHILDSPVCYWLAHLNKDEGTEMAFSYHQGKPNERLASVHHCCYNTTAGRAFWKCSAPNWCCLYWTNARWLDRWPYSSTQHMHMSLHSSILLSGHCQSTRSDSPSTAQPSVCKAHTHKSRSIITSARFMATFWRGPHRKKLA